MHTIVAGGSKNPIAIIGILSITAGRLTRFGILNYTAHASLEADDISSGEMIGSASICFVLIFCQRMLTFLFSGIATAEVGF